MNNQIIRSMIENRSNPDKQLPTSGHYLVTVEQDETLNIQTFNNGFDLLVAAKNWAMPQYLMNSHGAMIVHSCGREWSWSVSDRNNLIGQGDTRDLAMWQSFKTRASEND